MGRVIPDDIPCLKALVSFEYNTLLFTLIFAKETLLRHDDIFERELLPTVSGDADIMFQHLPGLSIVGGTISCLGRNRLPETAKSPIYFASKCCG